MRKRALSFLLSLAVLCSLCMPSVFAVESGYSDTQGHWAEKAIDRWSGYGIIGGYGGGLFGPDDGLTRAQMATILSNTLGLTEMAETPFADVPADAWYTPYILRCKAAGIMAGDGTNAYPDAIITRQEAMTMLCNAFAIAPAENGDLSAFADGKDTADWAVSFVAALVNSGIVGGVGGGRLAPTEPMTRAEVITVIDRTVVQYLVAPGEYKMSQSDGLVLVCTGSVTLTGWTAADILVTPAADGKSVTFSKATVTGSVTIQADDATITKKNSTLPEITLTGNGSQIKEDKPVSGGGGSYSPSTPSVPSGPSDLTVTTSKTVAPGTYQDVTIAAAVGDGEVVLNGLTIQGDLNIKGGGSNSIKLVDCTVAGKVIMAKTGGEAPRLHLTNTPIAKVEVQMPAIIEAADTTSAVTAVETKAALEVKGENTAISTITIPAEVESAIAVTVTAGTVETIKAKSEAIVSGAAGAVAEVVAEAPVSVAAEAVEKVEVPATAPADVAVTVTGSESVEIAVNSSNGVAITSGSATVEVSTKLETAPAVTVNGTAAHAHKWDGGKVTTDATCEGAGVKTYTCIAGGCDTTPATKTESIAALGHKYGAWAKLDDTNHQRVCSNDSNHVETAAHGWNNGVQTTAPTCEGEGVKTYTCSVCSGTKTEAIDATGHSYGKWAKVDAAKHQRVCANDAKHIETQDHTPVVDEAVAATCTETGLTEGSHCSVCSGVIVAQTTVEALDHDFTGKYIYDDESHWHVCGRDNCEQTDTKTGHTYDTTDCAKDAVCTCGYVKAAGKHSWDEGKVTTDPTCEGEGVKTYTCTVCSATETEPVAATGHSYGKWTKVDDASHQRVCTNDKTHIETDTHGWDNGVITTEPTEDTDGVKTYTCADCGGTKTETVPATGSTSQTVCAPKGILAMVQTGMSIKIGMDAPEDMSNIDYFKLGFYDSTNKGASLMTGITCSKDHLYFYVTRDKFDTAYTYDKVEITAIANTGYTNAVWTGDISVMHTEKTLAASYTYGSTYSQLNIFFETAAPGFYHIGVKDNGTLIENDSAYGFAADDGMSVMRSAIDSEAAAIEAGTAKVYVTGWNVAELVQVEGDWSITITTYPETEATMKEPEPEEPAQVGTVTFTNSNGLVMMNWVTESAPETITDYQSFFIQISSDGGETWSELGGLSKRYVTAENTVTFLAPKLEAGTYNKVRIICRTYHPTNGDSAWFEADCNVTVSTQPGMATATITPTGEEGYYEIVVTGLTHDRENVGSVEFAIEDPDLGAGSSCSTIQGTTDQWTTNDQNIPNGSYRIREYHDIVCNGNTCSFTIYEGTWLKCIEEESAASVYWTSDGKLGWTSVADASRYRVSVYEGAAVEGTAVLTRTPTATSYNMQNIVMTLAEESAVTYSVKVEALDSSSNVLSEVGTLNGAIVVTVAGTAADYAFTVGEDNKTYTMTFAEGTPNGPRTMFWTSADGTSEYNILNEYTALTSTYTRTNDFADGDTVSLRIFSSSALNGNSTVWSVILTPTSTKTYTAPSAATLVLDENYKLTIDFVKDQQYDIGFGLYCYDCDGNEVGYSFMYDGIDATVVLPCAPASGKYTLVVKGFATGAAAKEVVRLTDCIEVTVDGDAVGYEMVYDADTQRHTITLNSKPENGVWHLNKWFRGSTELGGGTGSYTSSTTTIYSNQGNLQDGDIFDLRIITAYALEDQIVKVTMTPESTKTYTALVAITNLRFESYDGVVNCIAWDGPEPTGAQNTAKRYVVETTEDGGATWTTFGVAGYEKKYPLFTEFSEDKTFNGIRVTYMDGETETTSITALDMSIKVILAVKENPVTADIAFDTENSGDINVTLHGLTTPVRFYFYTTCDNSQTQGGGYTGKVTTGETAHFTVSPKFTTLEEGRYLVSEFLNNLVSEDGKTASYTIMRSGWTSTLPDKT